MTPQMIAPMSFMTVFLDIVLFFTLKQTNNDIVLKGNTKISIIFEVSKYNLLIFNWFRKFGGGVIGALEGELGEVERRLLTGGVLRC